MIKRQMIPSHKYNTEIMHGFTYHETLYSFSWRNVRTSKALADFEQTVYDAVLSLYIHNRKNLPFDFTPLMIYYTLTYGASKNVEGANEFIQAITAAIDRMRTISVYAEAEEDGDIVWYESAVLPVQKSTYIDKDGEQAPAEA